MMNPKRPLSSLSQASFTRGEGSLRCTSLTAGFSPLRGQDINSRHLQGMKMPRVHRIKAVGSRWEGVSKSILFDLWQVLDRHVERAFLVLDR